MKGKNHYLKELEVRVKTYQVDNQTITLLGVDIIVSYEVKAEEGDWCTWDSEADYYGEIDVIVDTVETIEGYPIESDVDVCQLALDGEVETITDFDMILEDYIARHRVLWESNELFDDEEDGYEW